MLNDFAGAGGFVGARVAGRRVAVNVAVGGTFVGVNVAVCVAVAVLVGEEVTVGVFVAVAVYVDVAVCVIVAVFVAVGGTAVSVGDGRGVFDAAAWATTGAAGGGAVGAVHAPKTKVQPKTMSEKTRFIVSSIPAAMCLQIFFANGFELTAARPVNHVEMLGGFNAQRVDNEFNQFSRRAQAVGFDFANGDGCAIDLFGKFVLGETVCAARFFEPLTKGRQVVHDEFSDWFCRKFTPDGIKIIPDNRQYQTAHCHKPPMCRQAHSSTRRKIFKTFRLITIAAGDFVNLDGLELAGLDDGKTSRLERPVRT